MTRARVLLDTNVIVSALLFGGVPGEILDAARDREFDAVVSLHILAELREVLTRPRFGIDADLTDSITEEIASFCRVVPVERAEGAWCVDPDDDPIIEAALAAGARLVVTGDAHLLTAAVDGVEFLTPSELVERRG